MTVRDARQSDFPQVLVLNEESVQFLSSLTAERLARLDAETAYHRVYEAEGRVIAFLMAFREGATYDSPNYRWFAARYTNFLYIDRVVVSTAMQGRGIGRLLYADLFAYAKGSGADLVTCEFDVDPPNLPSRRFHEVFGFKEVGSQTVGAANKRVSLQAVSVTASGTS
jgi:uncharacterized protein